MDLNNFGENLKFNRRGAPIQAPEDLTDKEMFIRIVTKLDECWDASNKLYNEYKISTLEYEEGFYQIIEDLMNIHYGPWKAELMLWYVFGRFDADGELHPLIIQTKGKEDEKVYIKTPLQLWNFLDKLAKQKRKDENQ